MGTKRPEDMTPTEAFAQANYGAEPGPGTAYEGFRELVSKAYGANKLALGNAGAAAQDAVAKFQAWKNANPLAKWGVDVAPMIAHPAGGLIRGSVAAGQALRGGPPLNEPVGKQEMGEPREPTSFERDPYLHYLSPSALPDAAPDKRPVSGGPSLMGAPTNGMGSDKSLLGAQQDYIGDIEGLQNKKGEEVSARLGSLNTAADLKLEYANQQNLAADAYQRAVQKADEEQRGMATNVQQATDDVAARGVDPGRYYRNRDVGWWAGMLVGGIASGVLNALSGRGGENTFVSYVRSMALDDIQTQEKAIDQGWKRVKGLETAYERMRQLGVDKVTATQKQYDMTLAAFQTEIGARLQKAQIPEEKARLEAAMQEIQIERDKEAVKLQEYWKAVNERRASAAAASVMAQRNADRQARLDAVEMDLKRSQTTKNLAESDKLRAESGTGGLNKEDAARMRSLQSGYTAVDSAIKSFQGNTKGSLTGATPLSGIPGTDAMKYRQGVEEWNARATLLLGPIVETMNKGKPGAVEMHDLQKRVLIDPGMSQAEVVARMRYMQKLQNDAASTLGESMQQPASFGEGTSYQPRGP